MTENERKAWQTANTLWTELNLVSKRMNRSFGMASWSDDERQHIGRTLDRALDALNKARDRAGNLEG